MQYEGECIKNLEWAESYKNCIQWGGTDLNLLLPKMFDWINETIN